MIGCWIGLAVELNGWTFVEDGIAVVDASAVMDVVVVVA